MLGRKPSAICDKLFDRVVKSAFQVYMRTSWTEKLSDENLTFSCSDSEGKFPLFFESVWLGCQNCIPTGNRIILRRCIRCDFPPDNFRTLSKTFPGFRREFINWVVKTAFFVSRRNLWVEYFFAKKVVEFRLSLLDFQTKKNSFLTQLYCHVCQKCNLTVHWNNLRRGFLWKTFLASFRALAKNSWFFLE